MDALIFLTRKLPRRDGIAPNAPGQTMQVRILRECGRWRTGQTGTINAEYGRRLIGNGLAVEVIVNGGKAARSPLA